MGSLKTSNLIGRFAMEEKSGKAYVVDTNVLVHDPNSIDILREGGNTLIIPWVVTLELDRLKERPDIGLDAREAIDRIEKIRKDGDDSLLILRHPSFRDLKDLDRKLADHQVIATAKTLHREKKFSQVKIVSRDHTVRILARELSLVAEDYLTNQVAVQKYSLKELNVPSDCIDQSSRSFPYLKEEFEEIGENEGVVCFSEEKPGNGWRKCFAAIRKGDVFKIISNDIQASGLKPFSLNGDGPNWYQHVALEQLLDPTIELVFLQGGTGSGKTLLALASAIEQKKRYRQIIVTRPMVPLEDEDRMGFLPGNEQEKMSPWLRPVMQALEFLKNVDDGRRKHEIAKLVEEKKIDFESLDYIRGMTYYKNFLIVDEAQNLTPHQIKTIITRAGMHTKLVFTGDLGQIDRRRRLDEKSSGLAYSVAKMSNHPSVSVTTFKETVRSPLAGLAEERM